MGRMARSARLLTVDTMTVTADQLLVSFPHTTESDGDVTTIRTKSPKRDVKIKVTAIAANTTRIRIRIDIDEGYFFLKIRRQPPI